MVLAVWGDDVTDSRGGGGGGEERRGEEKRGPLPHSYFVLKFLIDHRDNSAGNIDNIIPYWYELLPIAPLSLLHSIRVNVHVLLALFHA